MTQELHSNIVVRQALGPVSVAANSASVGNIIDTQGFGGLEFVFTIGAGGTDAATFTVLIEHSDAVDMSGAEAIPDEQLLGSEAATSWTGLNRNGARSIGVRVHPGGTKRYVRPTVTSAGNSAAALFGATAILFRPHLTTPV